MPKLPVVSARDVVKALVRLGFTPIRQTGSHIHLWSEQKRVLVTVPNHSEIARGTLRGILRQARLSRAEFLREL